MTKKDFTQMWDEIMELPQRYTRRKDGGVPLLMVTLIRSNTNPSLNDTFIPYYHDVEIKKSMVIITKKDDAEPKERRYIPIASLIGLTARRHVDYFIANPKTNQTEEDNDTQL